LSKVASTKVQLTIVHGQPTTTINNTINSNLIGTVT
jgi:hypothetical protein